MKVTKAEVIRARERIRLPEPWRPAWREPAGEPVTSFSFSFYKVLTDEGIVGIGPYTGADPGLVEGVDPFLVEKFWNGHMREPQSSNSQKGAAGLEIALWDIIGKAANLPVCKLLGGCRDRILAYAATSRLLTIDQHVEQVRNLMMQGFKAVKLRLHRPDPQDDLAVVEAVREAVGDDMMILADANQNHVSEGYSVWSRNTAFEVAKRLQQLNVNFLEEPLPETDLDGLSELAASLKIPIAGGEQIHSPYGFKEFVLRDAYDILQPDVILGGNMGMSGLRKVANMADYFGKQIVPHILSGGRFPFALAATLHVMGSVHNCPMVEYPYDPPFLTVETCQSKVIEPFWIDEDGFVKIPDKPGLGLELSC